MLPCVIFAYQVIMGHLASYAVDIEIAPAAAAGVVSVMGAAGLIGVNLAGFLSDRIGARLYLIICIGMVTAALAWLLFASELWMLHVFAVVYGVGWGGFPTSHTLLTGNLFGLQHLGAVLAAMLVMGSVGGSIGAPLAGSIFDSRGSYDLAFIICLALAAAALVLSLFLPRTGSDS